MAITIAQALQNAARILSDHHSPSARIDASVLLAHVLDQSSSYLYTWPDRVLTELQVSNFDALIERRKIGEPIAYIVGYRDFWTLRLAVETSTLIPRPDTELLVELALEKLPAEASKVLDLGTGTGAIALSLASERSDIEVLGVDLRLKAVSLAIRNQAQNQIKNAHFLQSSWFDAIEPQQFSMIVSNPPYIDPADPHLSQGDVRFEPQSALVADDHGLADIRHICQHSGRFLQNHGYLLIEHGYDQAEIVQKIFIDADFINVETKQDYAGLDRVTIGQYVVDNESLK